VTLWAALFLGSSLSLLALPLVPALLEWRRKLDAAPLRVVREYDTNPAHFAVGFRSFVERQFGEQLAAAGEGDAIGGRLQDGTPFLLLGASCPFELSRDEQRDWIVRRLVVARGDLSLPGQCLFEADAYAGGRIVGQAGSAFRALFAEHDLILGEACAVLRWAHAGGCLRVGADLEAYGRMTAGRSIVLGRGSLFGRLHAPLIVFGEPEPEHGPATAPGGHPPSEPCSAVTAYRASGGRHFVPGDLALPDFTRHRGDLVTTGGLSLGAGSHVVGSLKSSADLRLGAGSLVQGALVALGGLFIEEGCQVAGPVVSESVVELGRRARVGNPNQATSISAPRVSARLGSRVHGTVWAREGGRVER